jgi:phosphoribosylaminoimidazolecarboxamide formyltransferase / IMP cyclohydrolase
MTVRCALLSVSDKIGIVEFARGLSARRVKLLSTGGTLTALTSAGLPAHSVEEFTGSPEVMGGRVKTLHPRVHGGLLARMNVDDADLARLGTEPIDLCVVNLYPFERTLRSGNASFSELIENIDIGGPCLLRASAKNHERVTVVCDPEDYERVLGSLDEHQGAVASALRFELAAKAFALTAHYDAQIASWMQSRLG